MRRILLITVLLAGCTPSALSSDGLDALPPLAGQVDMGVLYRLQASIEDDVAPAASVSFIEPGATPRTVITTVTDDRGRFNLALGRSFKPAVGSIYYLEAFKGLNSNMAGHDAIRVRTLVQWKSGGWTSLTSASPNVGLVISLSTTALSVAAQLNTAAGQTVSLPSLIGKLSVGPTRYAYVPVANLSDDEYKSAYGAVEAALGGNLDPIASIERAGGSFFLKGAGEGGGLGVTPGLGADIGDTVTLTGMTFDAVLAKNQVSFNGAPAQVTKISADRRSLEVTVPDGARRGPVQVSVGEQRSGTIDYPILSTVRLTLSGIPPGTTTLGVTLTPSSGAAQQRTVTTPGVTSTLVFKGLVPGTKWSLSAKATSPAGIDWATTQQLDGPLDPLTLTNPPIAGPFEVKSGLNAWTAGLRMGAIGGNAMGTF